jgi:branched-chain amino acid transport system substrate-binding protein
VLGPLADGVLASTEWVRDQPSSGPYFGSAEQYYRRYEQLMGARPDYHAAEASAGCIALVLAIEKAGSLSPAAVRRAMAGLDVDTFFGRIHFAPNGQNVGKGIAVVQLQRGQPVPVWPKDLAEAPLCWPAVSPAAARPTSSCVLGKARP